ncbi:MAG: YqcC family protein [Gammaproteobacteria bacterium]
MPRPEEVLSQLDTIETVMQDAGMWQAEALHPDQYDFRLAFASDTMRFEQWLQFVFVPAVRRAAEAGRFPSSSDVAVQAVRAFDGMTGADGLLTELARFDALFNRA